MTPNDVTLREAIVDTYGPDLVMLDGYDGAVLGVSAPPGMDPLVVYDTDKMVQILALDIGRRNGVEDTFDEAYEHLEKHVWRNKMGGNAPMFLKTTTALLGDL